MSILQFAAWGLFDDDPSDEILAAVNKEIAPWRHIKRPINIYGDPRWLVTEPSYKHSTLERAYYVKTFQDACAFCNDAPYLAARRRE